jgi:hypothetical protein
MLGKRIQFDDVRQAIDLLARDNMMNFQELADEAFRDLTNLKAALRQSVGQSAAVYMLPTKKRGAN